MKRIVKRILAWVLATVLFFQLLRYGEASVYRLCGDSRGVVDADPYLYAVICPP